jgi:superfamily I DNA/RNA helicase
VNLLASLNPEQRRAVKTTEGPVLVLAGAGTGKTRVITVRIAHLLKKGVRPESVLAMTFTNKAAREMRERVAELVGKKRAEKIFVGTFHAFCIDLLRKHGKAIGLDGFTISDGSDQLSMLRSLMREIRMGDFKMQPGAVLSQISLMKNRMHEPEGALEKADDDKEEFIARVWEKYDRQLRRSRALDFDDILLYALRLLQAPDGPREKLCKQYRYVMVDEYQDTNGPQYEIVRAITGARRNLCVVGDDDQSIYGWRGADIKKILRFDRDYENATVVKLETNYRSTEPILKAANSVIRNNADRHDKTLHAHVGEGVPVRKVRTEDENEEAERVVEEITTLIDEKKARLGDFAVLFRTGPQARVFEAELRTKRVPYVLVGGMSFFDRKEVRDIVAYLKLVVNPDDEVALLRAINCPPRGIGKASVDRILDHSAKEGTSISAAFENAGAIEGVPAATADSARTFFGSLTAIRKDKGSLPAKVQRVIDTFSYRDEVDRSYDDPAIREKRWVAVDEILNFAENHQRRAKRKASLETFLHELALEADDDKTSEDESDRNVVTLMTLHAAKGLEYPRVYLVGLEEGFLPHSRAVAEDTIDEERRLAYVGITRARRHLTLTWTKTRARHGRRSETMPSRFLFELMEKPPPEGWVAAGDENAVGVKKPQKKTKRGARTKRPRVRRH